MVRWGSGSRSKIAENCSTVSTVGLRTGLVAPRISTSETGFRSRSRYSQSIAFSNSRCRTALIFFVPGGRGELVKPPLNGARLYRRQAHCAEADVLFNVMR